MLIIELQRCNQVDCVTFGQSHVSCFKSTEPHSLPEDGGNAQPLKEEEEILLNFNFLVLLQYDLKTACSAASLRVNQSLPLPLSSSIELKRDYQHVHEHRSASNSTVKVTSCESPRALASEQTKPPTATPLPQHSILTGSSMQFMTILPGKIPQKEKPPLPSHCHPRPSREVFEDTCRFCLNHSPS